MKQPRVFYTPEYDISFWGIERLHPFDSRKPGRAWREARRLLGPAINASRAAPRGPVDPESLRLVHDPAYLETLKQSPVVAGALELPLLRFLPASVLESHVLLPMRWAVQGTIDAARAALEMGSAINLTGGYHHAHRDHGEGFCVYADVPIATEVLRREGRLAPQARVAVIDLDAHRGNGFEAIYENDERVQFLDLYNFQIYPGRLSGSADPLSERPQGGLASRFPQVIGLRAGLDDEGYGNVLKHELPHFLSKGPYALAFYNAGTDVLEGDPLGRLGLSRDAVLARDRFVMEALDTARLPWVMLPSGGYTAESHSLLAATVAWACQRRSEKVS